MSDLRPNPSDRHWLAHRATSARQRLVVLTFPSPEDAEAFDADADDNPLGAVSLALHSAEVTIAEEEP